MTSFQKTILASLVAASLSACGGSGGGDTTPEPQTANKAPTLSVANASVRERAQVSLTATASDADGSIASYRWTQKAGAAVALSGDTSTTLSFTAPEVAENQTLVFSLTVTDNQGATASQDVEVTVVNNSLPGISVADVSVKEGESATVAANVSDSDGTVTKLAWSQKSGTGVTLSGADSQTLSFTAPAVVADETLVFTLSATDNDGETSSRDVTVTVTANLVSLTLEGKVTDNPIANAKVTAEVAGKQFHATADADGLYSLALEVDDSLLGELVKLSAVGPETDSKTRLVALLGSVNRLLDMAGSDATLTREETILVNVTNVSTAVAALLKEANGGEAVTTAETFESLQNQYDATRVLPLATAIKLVLDFAPAHELLKLPEGVADTQALVEDKQQVLAYLTKVKGMLLSVYEAAEAEIIDDPNLMRAPVQSSEVVGSYFFKYQDGVKRGDRLVLAANGTGQLHLGSAATAFTWEKTEVDVRLTLPNDGVLLYEDSVYSGGQLMQRQNLLSHKVIKWIDASATGAQLLVSDYMVHHYPNGEREDEFSEQHRTFSVVKTEGLAKGDTLITAGSSFSVPVPTETMAILNGHEKAGKMYRSSLGLILGDNHSATVNIPQFLGDGSVQYQALSGSYSFSDNGNLKVMAQDGEDNIALDVAFLGSDTPLEVNVVEAASGYAISGLMLKQSGAQWTAATAAGIYALDWDFFTPGSYFWVELNADGTMLTFDAFDKNKDGLFEASEVSKMPGYWRLNDSGTVSMRRYLYNHEVSGKYGYCQATGFETGLDDSCAVAREREWTLQQQQGSSYYVSQLHRFYMDSQGRSYLGADLPADVHVLDSAQTDNRRWTKITERPITLPEGM